MTHRNFYLIQGSHDGETWKDMANEDGYKKYHEVVKYFRTLTTTRPNRISNYDHFRIINREVRDTVHEVSE